MKFRHGDRVYVKRGFHRGRHGTIFAKVFLEYGVAFSSRDLKWFFPWQLGKPVTIRPVDNSATMDNVRRAQEIINSVKKA